MVAMLFARFASAKSSAWRQSSVMLRGYPFRKQRPLLALQVKQPPSCLGGFWVSRRLDDCNSGGNEGRAKLCVEV